MILTDLLMNKIKSNAQSDYNPNMLMERHEDSVERDKEKLLGDPVAIEKAVANMADYLSPTASSKKPKGESYGLDSVEGSKSSSDPTRGFGITLRDEYTRALANPEARGIPAGKLLQNIADNMMQKPQEDGTSLMDKAYRYTRTESDRLWGGDKVKPIPGYDSWYKDKRMQEQADVDKESWFASPKDIIESAGLGAAIGGIGGATGGGLTGAGAGAAAMGIAGLAMGGPVGGLLGTVLGAAGGAAGSMYAGGAVGAVAGGVTGAVGEILGAPVKKLLHKTDWYQGQIQSTKAIDKANAILADVAAVALPGIATEKGMLKAGNKFYGDALSQSLGGDKFEGVSGMFEGKAPAGPGINLSGERINPNGSWTDTGIPLERVPNFGTTQKRLGYTPQEFTDDVLNQANPNRITYKGKPWYYPGPSDDVPPTDTAPNLLGYSPSRPDNLGSLDKDITKEFPSDFGFTQKKPPLLLEDLDSKELSAMDSWQRTADGKLYSDVKIATPGKQWTEEEIFDRWGKYAAGKVYAGKVEPDVARKMDDISRVATKTSELDVALGNDVSKVNKSTSTEDILTRQLTDEGINPLQKDIQDVATIDTKLPSILADKEKSVAKVMEKPTADAIIEAKVPTINDLNPDGTNKIVAKANELDDISAKEAGIIPMEQADVEAGLVPLNTGTVSGNISAASDKQGVIEVGKTKGVTGKRKKIVDTAVAGEVERKTVTNTFASEQAKDPNSVINATPASETLNITPTAAKKQKAQAAIKTITTEYDPFYEEAVGMSRGDYVSSMVGKAGEDPGRLKLLNKKVTDLDKKANKTLGRYTLEKGYKRDHGMSREEFMQETFGTTDVNILKEADRKFLQTADNDIISHNQELADRAADAAKKKAEKAVKLVTGMAAFGFGAGAIQNMISDFMPEESGIGNTAEAGALSEAAKGIMAGAKKSQYFAKAVGRTQTILESENLQNGIITNAFELLPKLKDLIKSNIGKGSHYALMSPYQVVESVMKTGEGKAINPAPFAASFVSAGATNVKNSSKVVKNIFDEAGISVAANQVKDAMSPLVGLAAQSAKADAVKLKIGRMENRLKFLQEKKDPKDAVAHAADIAGVQDEIVKLQDTLPEMLEKQKEFISSWETTARKLSEDHASVRVSLAIEDPERTMYPWLSLNRNEEVAVGKIRTMLDQYRGRLEDRKLRVRDDYFPHSPHPDAAKAYQDAFEDIAGGAPYSKFYSRTDNSRPLLPDAHYSMNHYLNDIEQRIQHHDMWNVSGWNKVRLSNSIKANPALDRAFTQLYEGTKPQDKNIMNTLARGYTEFEAFKRLFLNPSAGLKHLVKMSADLVTMGPKVFAESAPDVAGYITRKVYGLTPDSVKNALSTIGIKSDRFSRQVTDDYIDSIIQSGHMRKYLNDVGMDNTDEILSNVTSTLKDTWGKVQDVGSFWINTAELLDRGMSVMSGLRMAAKKGMTVDQAMYGTYDTILKNNFLYGQFNPSWLNDPKIRGFLMFQATPFKIFERRLVNLQKGIGTVNNLYGEAARLWKTPEGREKIFSDLKELRSSMREGESRLKSNLVIDALKSETDFFGTPVARQLMWDMLTVGAATYGGAQAGLHLKSHFFHIPFLSTMSEEGKMELAVSPITKATMEGYNSWKKREDSDDFLLGTIMSKWLGKFGPLPDTLKKVTALGGGDIPEIYRKGGGNEYLKYLFSVPGEGE